jgi:hypothetical protein
MFFSLGCGDLSWVFKVEKNWNNFGPFSRARKVSWIPLVWTLLYASINLFIPYSSLFTLINYHYIYIIIIFLSLHIIIIIKITGSDVHTTDPLNYLVFNLSFLFYRRSKHSKIIMNWSIFNCFSPLYHYNIINVLLLTFC